MFAQDDDGDGIAPLDDEGMTPFEEAPPPSQDIHMSDSQMPGTFTGDNLVEPPSKVARVFIPYALRPKKMDMKKLKAQIWSLLVHWNTRKEKVQPPTYDSTKVEGEIRFTEVFKELPSKLSATMIENLSFPLAYIALLHLANEKCLLIVGDENLEDLMSALVSFLRTCTGRATLPLYCLDPPPPPIHTMFSEPSVTTPPQHTAPALAIGSQHFHHHSLTFHNYPRPPTATPCCRDCSPASHRDSVLPGLFPCLPLRLCVAGTVPLPPTATHVAGTVPSPPTATSCCRDSALTPSNLDRPFRR
uniref:Condensin complex subunit 2 n=1 Tax=Timema monikensis TaxID=170555 RepID=A0A7R9E475_9NEOP|nr:unnamed protein product [Timema monikensis]